MSIRNRALVVSTVLFVIVFTIITFIDYTNKKNDLEAKAEKQRADSTKQAKMIERESELKDEKQERERIKAIEKEQRVLQDSTERAEKELHKKDSIDKVIKVIRYIKSYEDRMNASIKGESDNISLDIDGNFILTTANGKLTKNIFQVRIGCINRWEGLVGFTCIPRYSYKDARGSIKTINQQCKITFSADCIDFIDAYGDYEEYIEDRKNKLDDRKTELEDGFLFG